ncbi:hypothetical protein ACFFRR_008333 [Megaselia abdita]
MKVFILFAALISAAVAVSDDGGVLRQESVVSPEGFESHLELHDQKQDASGHLVGEALAHTGSYSWTDPNGEQVSISYTADENGYHPTGTGVHPIPDAIVRSLVYLEAHAPKDQH